MKDPIRLYRKDLKGETVSRVALYKVSGGYSLMALGRLGQSFTDAERQAAFTAYDSEVIEQITARKKVLAERAAQMGKRAGGE